MSLEQKITDAKRIEFAKQLEYLYQINHVNWGKVFLFSMVKGIGSGLGILIGGTIIVAILLWILTLLGSLPFLNDLTDSVKHTLEQPR